MPGQRSLVDSPSTPLVIFCVRSANHEGGVCRGARAGPRGAGRAVGWRASEPETASQ